MIYCLSYFIDFHWYIIYSYIFPKLRWHVIQRGTAVYCKHWYCNSRVCEPQNYTEQRGSLNFHEPEQNQTALWRHISFWMAHGGTIILRVTKARPRGYGGEGTRRETSNSWLQMAPPQQRFWSWYCILYCAGKSPDMSRYCTCTMLGKCLSKPAVELQVLQSWCS